MTESEIREFLSSFAGSTEDTPFGPQAYVYKLEGKMFCTFGWDEDPLTLTVKVPPEIGEILREQYPSISEGYYMNKRHWITIAPDGQISYDLVKERVAASYELIMKSLPRKVQATYKPAFPKKLCDLERFAFNWFRIRQL